MILCYLIGGKIKEHLRKQLRSDTPEELVYNNYIFKKHIVPAIDGNALYKCINEEEIENGHVCDFCDEGFVDCMECDGSGKVKCYDCGGKYKWTEEKFKKIKELEKQKYEQFMKDQLGLFN